MTLGSKIEAIESFTGDYRFLSNFYPANVQFDGLIYMSVENAYQAAKTLVKSERKPFREMSPAAAKKAGRKLTLREDWESVKLTIMADLLTQKFAHADLRELLLATGARKLVEGNWWGDRYWGVDGGVGENHLGRLLMKTRAAIVKGER